MRANGLWGVRRKLGLLLAAVGFCGAVAFSASGATVTVSGYRILLDGKPFVIKGVNYSPVPIGVKPSEEPYGDYFTSNYRNVWGPDIQKMRKAGVNCIKLYAGNPGLNAKTPGSGGNWKPFLDELWNNGDHPIYVLMFSYMQGGSIQEGGANYKGYVNDYTNMVKSTITHPAVIGYTIGNEIFGDAGYVNNPNSAFWKNFGAVFDAAHEAGVSMGKVPFLITAITDGRSDNTWPAIQFGEKSKQLGHLDAWAINVYRGPDFGGDGPNSVFKQYVQQMQAVNAGRPLIIGEWGTPHSTRSPYGSPGKNSPPINLDDVSPKAPGQKSVGEFLTTQWNTLKANIGASSDTQVAVGGFIFGFVDEYWKGDNVDEHVGGPGNQSFLGGAYAGGYADEAWYGLTEAVAERAYGAGKQNVDRKTFDGYRAMDAFYSAASDSGAELYKKLDNEAPDLSVRRNVPKVRGETASVIKVTLPLNALSFVIRGTASDDERVAGIQVRGDGGLRIARGRENWSLRVTPKSGTTVYTVRAFDASGNKSKPKRIVVKREF